MPTHFTPTAPDLQIARSLLHDTEPLLRCHLWFKRPMANDTGTWDSINDPDLLEGWLKPGDNLAILLGWSKQSPVIAVGLDVYKDPAIIEFAKSLGVTTRANVWAERTGTGGYTVIYHFNGPPLKRDTSQKDSAIDLLVNGYTLIPPATRQVSHKGEGHIAGLPGRSPLDISLAELDEPPQDLLVWWQSLSTPKLPDSQRDSNQSHSPSWLVGVISEGQRNTALTQRAGYYHRMIPDDEAVRHLIHSANLTDCRPTLPNREVDIILDSILKRDGAAHFRGVRPAKLEMMR